jgi:signal transduction histidine kinase
MDFVTGVSHELRTPLTVIRSAADNIADGYVEGKQQLMRYGEAIRKQARQLSQLIDQVLLFASTRQEKLVYTLAPLKVEAVVDAAINNTAELAAQAGFTIERQMASELPEILGELEPLSHCVQNLITNAVKYGGQDRWIGVRAEKHGPEMVRITVEDHGVGISAAELRHIFEPFYRSRQVIAAQIHGTGLGLTLARSVAEAMGGNLTATSEAGKESAFHLDLRVADRAATNPAEAGAESAATVE